MVPYKYIAPSGIWSTEAEGRLLSVHNSTSKPPRLDTYSFVSNVSRYNFFRCRLTEIDCTWYETEAAVVSPLTEAESCLVALAKTGGDSPKATRQCWTKAKSWDSGDLQASRYDKCIRPEASTRGETLIRISWKITRLVLAQVHRLCKVRFILELVIRVRHRQGRKLYSCNLIFNKRKWKKYMQTSILVNLLAYLC